MHQRREWILTDDELMLPSLARVLDAPEDFAPGIDGQYLGDLAAEYAEKLVRPIWYVLHKDAGKPMAGSRLQGDKSRLLTARIGFNRQERTQLYVYGRLKPHVSSEPRNDRVPKGRQTAFGRRVWGYLVSRPEEQSWEVDIYYDDRGYFWTVRQDQELLAIDLESRYRTNIHAFSAAIDRFIEGGVPDLLPILVEP